MQFHPGLICQFPLVLLILSLVLSGCAATNIMQFHDAQTLSPGDHKITTFIANGPNLLNLDYDSTRQIGTTFDPVMGLTGRLGIAEGLDIGGTWWFSNIPLVYLAVTGVMDSGLKGDLRWELTAPHSEDKIALTAMASGYYTINSMVSVQEHRIRGDGGTWSLGAGAIYAFTWGDDISTIADSRSLYFGIGVQHMASDYSYAFGLTAGNDRHIQQTTIGIIPSLGFRIMDKSCFEVSSLFARNPWNGRSEWAVYAGMAVNMGM
jgi:hypothetical protein